MLQPSTAAAVLAHACGRLPPQEVLPYLPSR